MRHFLRWRIFLGTDISVNTHAIQSVAKNLENILVDILVYVTEIFRTESSTTRYHKVGVTEILPPYGRLNDTLC